MKVLLISNKKTDSVLLNTLNHEGHATKHYVHNERGYFDIKGKLSEALSLRQALTWIRKDGLILCTAFGLESMQSELQNRGYTILGGIQRHYLCCDNVALERTLRTYGVHALPTFQFSSVAQANNFIQNNKERWVLKQSTHSAGISTHVSACDDSSDLFLKLDEIKKKKFRKLHLQKYAAGIEVTIERNFNGSTWVGPIGVHHEHLDANKRVTIVWNTSDANFPLFERTLLKLAPYFRDVRYRGNITITCIAEENNIWPIRFKFGLRPITIDAQCELYNSPVGEFLHNIAKGRHAGIAHKEGYAIATTSGSSCRTAFGKTIPEAKRKLLGLLSVDNIAHLSPNIGDSTHTYEIPTLSRWGWI